MGYRSRGRLSDRPESVKSILARKSKLVQERLDLVRRLEVLRKAKPDFDRFNADLVTEGKTSISRFFNTESNRNN